MVLTQTSNVVSLNKHRQREDDLDLRPVAECYPLIEHDEVCVVYRRSFAKTMFSKVSHKLCVVWSVCEPGQADIHNVELLSYYRLRANRRVALSSRYMRDWIVATGRKPARRDRMSPAVFKNKLFRARLRVVATDSRQRPLPEAARYSVVDELIELVVG